MAPLESKPASFPATSAGELIHATPKRRQNAYHATSNPAPNAICHGKALRCIVVTDDCARQPRLAAEDVSLRLPGEVRGHRLFVRHRQLRLGPEEIRLERLLELLGSQHRGFRNALQVLAVGFV